MWSGPLSRPFSRVLTNVMFSWVTGTAGSAARLYDENLHGETGWGRPPLPAVRHLMADLRRREGVSILYITHDIASARYVADRILVMYAGHIVEGGPAETVLADPRHPYTQLLLSAAPDPREPVSVSTSVAVGEPPRVVNPPDGCRFRPRCPVAIAACENVTPRLRVVAPAHDAACHVATTDPGIEAAGGRPA